MKETPKINTELIWKMLDENALIVSPQEGQVRVLNEVGSIIWKLITEQKKTKDITNHLIDNYNVTPEQAALDLKNFLAELHERGLVSLS